MIKLGGIISRNAFVNEAESDKYTHIGYGMYKQKGKEKDKDAPTFKKDGEKYIPFKKGDAAKGGGTSAGEDKPKVNIFDKPKEKQPTKPKTEPSTESSFEKDSIVYNKRTKTVGIVRLGDERGETKTDADGNVNTSELEPYNPMKYPHQKGAKVAPSTKKEIDTRKLWKPFSQDTSTRTKPEIHPNVKPLEKFIDWAVDSKDVDDFIGKVRTDTNVPRETQQMFHDKYGHLNMRTAASEFMKDAKSGLFYQDNDKTDDNNTIPSTKLKDLMPKSDKDTFSGKSDIPKLSKNVQHQISMKIDELDKLAREAKQKGTEAPNYNLCKITVAGTNLYCDNNLGIPRDEMPQFKGTPRPGSPASKMKLNDNGEVDTEPVFKEMLKKKGIKTAETTIPADALKATQSELVGTKVAGMVKALEKEPNNPGINAPIYVSRDGYVIDGHHRWAAVTSHSIAKGKPTNMKVIVIDDDAKNIIPMANKFADEMGIESKKADANQETGTSSTKDSSGNRAGHPETNKFTRTLAQKAGITPKKLGSTEYKKKMVQAAHAALVDSNHHAGARKLIATIENKPEWETEPKYPSISDPDYKKKMADIKQNSVDSSQYADYDETVDKFGIAISKKAGWDGIEAIDAIAFDLKMNGYKDLASKIQSIYEVKSTRLTSMINEDHIVNKEIAHYTGARESAIADFIKTHNIDGEKLVKYVRKGNIKDRMNVMSAIAGRSGNNIQKDIINKFGIKESKINEARSLSTIAYDIQKDWKNVNYAAKPYLQAMYSLDSINDRYGYDSGRSVVAYFLSNASQWKGDTAKRIKDELKKMLK